LDFERASFLGGETRFRNAIFSGQTSFRRTTLDTLLVLDYVRLRGQILFDGTILKDGCRVLLWGLNFVHGISDIAMDEDHRQGRITAPAGQVVFRDITNGMNQVSFLHTDMQADRLFVRFSNVKWKANPREFIFDAKFAFEDNVTKWQLATGLPVHEISRLPELYFADRPEPKDEAPEQKAEREIRKLQDCAPLIKQDAVRIAREIRRSTEQYGSYSDAGDFHIAEMEYRRVQSPRFSFQRLLLAGYKCFSEYGESPRRAFKWFFGVWFVSALLYIFAGFSFGKVGTVRYELALDGRPTWPAFWHVCADFLHALAFSFVSLVPGYFRFSAPAEWPTWATPFIVVAEAVFGIGLLTLFLLAIRRRFRR
jgi:hypothetical protein